ncbi:hypothetical protein GCM10022273_02810 [Cellulomonas soli]
MARSRLVLAIATTPKVRATTAAAATMPSTLARTDNLDMDPDDDMGGSSTMGAAALPARPTDRPPRGRSDRAPSVTWITLGASVCGRSRPWLRPGPRSATPGALRT